MESLQAQQAKQLEEHTQESKASKAHRLQFSVFLKDIEREQRGYHGMIAQLQ